MESVVGSVLEQASINSLKSNEVSDKSSIETNVCHKSNGVAESVNVVPDSSEGDNVEVLEENVQADSNAASGDLHISEEPSVMVSTSEVESTLKENSNVEMVTEVAPAESTVTGEVTVPELSENVASTEIVETVEADSKDSHLNDVQMEEVVESEIIESTNDNVRFETEILVETNDNDINEIEIRDEKAENESPNNILNELGQNIELSEVLRSSDIAENVENNNCPIRQEVFNKEELLDILEGNDVQPSGNQVVEALHNNSMLEAQLAYEQISRLKNNRKNRHSESRKKSISVQGTPIRSVSVKSVPNKSVPIQKEENIVKALVKDWDDDEPSEEQHSAVKESLSQPEQENEVGIKEENTVDSSTGDGQTPDLNKSCEDGQPQRRLGRVIKKKVIFDPDNPDTFTKSKTLKNKETENDKDQHQPKKAKLEQLSLRAKSKSPVSKMQWKKPQPKNSKQNKRLTEVDKLLMDEGAVNMIYQLTPEAPKGKKNMKTKAEFIKKLQSSTPEGKEMKFRERKKESLKGEENEAKRILSGKQRSSLSSSVKSPSVSEDFETHSADDSIIYRRHSSSSYSSSCVSPRRLSDVDTNQSSANSQTQKADVSCGDVETEAKVFTPDSSLSKEIINKDDCLTIKKKLNSKLSLALNKRKRESSKTDKPIKKKVIKKDGVQEKEDGDNFKYLSLTFDQRVAEICIRKSGSNYDIEVLKEIEDALSYVDVRKDVSVTLLMSECGGLCSDLDFELLLDEDIEKKNKCAGYIAESVRSVLAAVAGHSKLVCCGVWRECAGVALGLLALSDVALAGARAVFALQPRPLLAPLAALRASSRSLPPNIVKDLVIFGRQLTASEALQYGLVNRVLWPSGVVDQIQAIVRDIAAQPPQALLLKKKLLNLGKTADSTFLSQLESEAALMAEYWTSDEGQESLRANTGAV